jgi:hypothetical protein
MLPDCMALLRQASFFLLNDRGEGGGTKRLGVIWRLTLHVMAHQVSFCDLKKEATVNIPNGSSSFNHDNFVYCTVVTLR